MKKQKSLLALAVSTLLFLSCLQSHAKIWRVNNNSNYNGVNLFGDNWGGTPAYPVFNQVCQATDSASINDTIHVEPSFFTYGPCTINKKLVIIGSGFFISENAKAANGIYNSKILSIAFAAGAEFSQLIGMDVVYSPQPGTGVVYIGCDHVTIKRCRFEGAIQLSSSVASPTILQNYFANPTASALVGTGQVQWMPPSDIIFDNNIVRGTLLWYLPTTQLEIFECNNNVFDGPSGLMLNLATSSFKNNILKTVGATTNINNGTYQNVSYTTCTDSSQFPGTSNIVVEPNMTNVFQTSFPSTDGKYQLIPSWALTNPGLNGDRGAFDGPSANRYTLSGLAAIPVIYDATTNGISQPGNLLPVNVKARTIK